MSNSNFLANKAAIINISFNTIIFANIIIYDLSTNNKNCLFKLNNIWFLKISTADKKVFKKLSNPKINFYIQMSSHLFESKSDVGWSEEIEDYSICNLLHKEHYNLLIEMNYVFHDYYLLKLDVEFDRKSNTTVLID